MKIHHVCFDLDGTLVKSDKTILKALLETLSILKIRGNISADEFNDVIGLHFFDIFKKFNIVVPDFDKFIKTYKSVYFDFINESELYPDVEETLITLNSNEDLRISLLTTKAQDQEPEVLQPPRHRKKSLLLLLKYLHPAQKCELGCSLDFHSNFVFEKLEVGDNFGLPLPFLR